VIRNANACFSSSAGGTDRLEILDCHLRAGLLFALWIIDRIAVGADEGLRHCDALVSLAKSSLTHFVGTLASGKLVELDQALAVALEIGQDAI
jgi:hypothetical protein